MSIATEAEKKEILKNKAAPKEEPKKRHHGWVVALIIILLIIALPIACLYIFIYDASSAREAPEYDLDTALKQKSVLAIDEERANSDLIDASFDENDFRGILAKALEKKEGEGEKENKNGLSNYLSGVDVRIEDNRFSFEIYIANLPVNFKTKLTITADFKQANDDYVFNIVDLKIGKISTGTSAFGIAAKYINDDSINEAFANEGVHVTCKLGEGAIYYPKANLEKDVLDFLKKGFSDDDNLYTAVLNEFLDLNIFTVKMKDNALTAEFNVESIKDNKDYLTPSKNITLTTNDFASYRDKAMTLINAEGSGFDAAYPYSSYVMEYLIRGYDGVSEETQKYIKDKDFSALESPKIIDVTAYKGAEIIPANIDLQTLLDSKATEFIAGGVKVTETELNAMFQNTPLIGKTFMTTALFGDKYKGSFATVNNFYSNITDEKISFVFTVNIGGAEIPFVLNFKDAKNTTDAVITLKKDEFYIGDKIVSDDLSETLFDTLADTLENEEWIAADTEAETIKIKGIMNPARNKVTTIVVPPLNSTKATLHGSSISDEGYMFFETTVSLGQ